MDSFDFSITFVSEEPEKDLDILSQVSRRVVHYEERYIILVYKKDRFVLLAKENGTPYFAHEIDLSETKYKYTLLPLHQVCDLDITYEQSLLFVERLLYLLDDTYKRYIKTKKIPHIWFIQKIYEIIILNIRKFDFNVDHISDDLLNVLLYLYPLTVSKHAYYSMIKFYEALPIQNFNWDILNYKKTLRIAALINTTKNLTSFKTSNLDKLSEYIVKIKKDKVNDDNFIKILEEFCTDHDKFYNKGVKAIFNDNVISVFDNEEDKEEYEKEQEESRKLLLRAAQLRSSYGYDHGYSHGYGHTHYRNRDIVNKVKRWKKLNELRRTHGIRELSYTEYYNKFESNEYEYRNKYRRSYEEERFYDHYDGNPQEGFYGDPQEGFYEYNHHEEQEEGFFDKRNEILQGQSLRYYFEGDDEPSEDNFIHFEGNDEQFEDNFIHFENNDNDTFGNDQRSDYQIESFKQHQERVNRMRSIIDSRSDSDQDQLY